MPSRFLILSLVTLVALLLGGWYIYDQSRSTHTPVVLIQSATGLVSDLANPFSSGSSPVSEEEISDKTGSILTTTGITETPDITYNTTWTPRTLSGIYYQFGVGNPRETDKSVEELIEMNKKCLNWDHSCEILISRFGEGGAGGIIHEDGTVELHGEKPARITPEIEYLVYSFLSNPVIRQSSEKCGEFFWNFQQAYEVYNHEVSDLGDSSEEYGPTKWWNPYNIDINDIIRIHPYTGRKELNVNIIATLNTQIQSPSIHNGGRYHTNTKLTECLAKNNILAPLQAHVDRHYRELMLLWREYKVED